MAGWQKFISPALANGFGTLSNPRGDPSAYPPPVLIVGCPRSGTHLLAASIGAAFGIAFPLETHFIPRFGQSRHLWGDLSLATNRRDMLHDIYKYTRIWLRALPALDPLEKRDNSLLATLPQAEKIIEASNSFETMVVDLFQEFAATKGLARFGDKSVYYRPFPVDLTKRVFPKSFVIHLVRDGRAVSYSWRSTWFGPKSETAAAKLWSEHVDAYRGAAPGLGTRYLEIRFEDLVTAHEETLGRIGLFLGVEGSRRAMAAADHSLAKAMSRLPGHTQLAQPPNPETAKRWRTGMSAPNIASFEKVAADQLQKLGYEAASSDQRPLRFFQRLALAREAVSVPGVFRMGRELVPTAMGWRRRLGRMGR
ncbi:MAG: sulfotransferase [Alphaproteobacteria bacterium]|nr:sulfotransferase [Alphaproteobacteria bacterium]